MSAAYRGKQHANKLIDICRAKRMLIAYLIASKIFFDGNPTEP